MERQDGHYRFVEDSQTKEDGDIYWTPTYWSGIYEKSGGQNATLFQLSLG